jgi:protein phosphatase
MRIEIPELALVALVGVSGSGKSTFAKKYFKPTEVLSSDYFRALVSDDENNQLVTSQAFDALYFVAEKRLELGHLTVIDATNVQKEARASALKLAIRQDCQAGAIGLNTPENICKERNEARTDRNFNGKVIRRQAEQLRRSIKYLQKEGFRYVYVLKSEDEIANVEIIRKPLWNNKKDVTGAFDIIGDIHGCYDELCALLLQLGYVNGAHTDGRKIIFLGDLCDRGTKNVEVLRLVMDMVQAGNAYCVAGNHDAKLLKKLKGANVKLTHGLDITVEQIYSQDENFINETKKFLDSLISHYVFDDRKLVVAHAGLIEKYQGRASGRVREFCLYGDTTGETDEYGLPVRLPWANDYRGRATVVYGHTPCPDVQAVNNTFCIDTGCVFGGKLTAFRYPEKTIVQVNALAQYCVPVKPIALATNDDMLNIDDVLGQKYLTTSLRRSIKINSENSAAALEIMSRFAADPHWLIYLPPTMSPCETSKLPDSLEYPSEAFDYYKNKGIAKVICQQKHMGSRGVIVLCKDKEIAERRFKTNDGSFGIIYTRTGRHFFDDAKTETAILTRLQNVLSESGFWDAFETDWLCLDCEIMPWSAKAQKLLEEQYAPVGCAGKHGISAAIDAISKATAHLGENTLLSELHERFQNRADAISRYTTAYRGYCWDVKDLDDYLLAPFHILATEGKTWFDENHAWHMETIAKYMTDTIFTATSNLLVDLHDENSVNAAIKWWEVR